MFRALRAEQFLRYACDHGSASPVMVRRAEQICYVSTVLLGTVSGWGGKCVISMRGVVTVDTGRERLEGSMFLVFLLLFFLSISSEWHGGLTICMSWRKKVGKRSFLFLYIPPDRLGNEERTIPSCSFCCGLRCATSVGGYGDGTVSSSSRRRPVRVNLSRLQ